MHLYLSSKILLVANNASDITDIKETLTDFGYKDILLAIGEHEALAILSNTKLSLIITSLFLGERICLNLLKTIIDSGLPAIVIASSYESLNYPSIIDNERIAYLVNPIHKLTFKTLVRLFLSKSNPDKSIFITGNHNEQISLNLNEILFLEAERNYCTIYTSRWLNSSYLRFTIKVSLVKLTEKLDSRFVRVHHSYIVNLNYVKSFSSNHIHIDNYTLPLSRTYKKKLYSLLNSLQSKHS
ncbi:LytTR family transcriptional regulator DNA-binding domain-containing protein [Runella sp. MFBS21]|uniref:LytTR family transcriptional regulator DNA-binding domain-containing protein n=1 Tax=Runella sp. MFBS21 TaxID=3034018 RepID=UPI0023F67BCD|nr:LytTR family transcriptional regulator DNA-binding domain-containing protein [Runella sp. MFBS21]MDF7819283.1 LytTR family transcriptional regulator DNA-binding domain-containing protein [Runella sp. MFBS21]